MNTFDLSRSWFNFAFENPELVKPIHSAIFFFAIEHCNRLGNKEKFGFPSQMTMDAIGVKKFQTYGKALNELAEWGFIKFIERSKNQYSANIISISATPKKGIARGRALDKATIKHGSKQWQSTGQGMDSIDKPLNHETMKPLNHKEPVFNFKKEFLDLGVEKEILEDWLKVRKNKKATNSKTAFNGILKKIEASGLTANECIKISAENSWSGFNNKWIEEKEKSSAQKEKLNVTQRVLKGDYEEVTEMILNATHNPQYKKISGE